MNFIDFARAHGVTIGDLYPSDKIRRCPTEANPRSKNGAYLWDGERGFVFAWDGEMKAQWYNDANAKPWTEAEKRAWTMKRRAAEQSREREYEQAALAADIRLRSAKLTEHDYLARKGFPTERGLVDSDGTLLIPMRGLGGELQGLQHISWEPVERKWVKKMQLGMRAKGAIYRMGPKQAQETFLVEGYATGLSVHAALRAAGLRASVVVCFSAGNLALVGSRMPGAFVIADHDASGAGAQAAMQTGLKWGMPETVGQDANDLHQASGLMALTALLMKVRKM